MNLSDRELLLLPNFGLVALKELRDACNPIVNSKRRDINAKRCDKCIYWIKNQSSAYGQCRFSPPSPEFPTTHDDMWCGQFNAAPA